MACNEAWVHLHGDVFITIVVSAKTICHITFKTLPLVPMLQVLNNFKMYQMTLNLYKGQILFWKRSWYVDFLYCGIDLLIQTVLSVKTNDVHINAFLFFLTYFCQIDLETNYLNDYLVDLRTLGLETKFH